MPQPLPDYYEILQVLKDASPEQLQAAKRKRLKENHPDMVNGLRARYKGEDDPVLQEVLARAQREADERTKQINLAYETLSDPAKRARYDAQRRGGHEADENSPFSRAYAASRPVSGQQRRTPPGPSSADLQVVGRVKALIEQGRYKEAFLLLEQIAFQPLRQQWQAKILEHAYARPPVPQQPVRPRSVLSCPQCGDHDRVAKVSGLVSSQSLQGRVVTSTRRQGTHYITG